MAMTEKFADATAVAAGGSNGAHVVVGAGSKKNARGGRFDARSVGHGSARAASSKNPHPVAPRAPPRDPRPHPHGERSSNRPRRRRKRQRRRPRPRQPRGEGAVGGVKGLTQGITPS